MVSQAGHFIMVASLLHMHVGHSHLPDALELNIADREEVALDSDSVRRTIRLRNAESEVKRIEIMRSHDDYNNIYNNYVHSSDGLTSFILRLSSVTGWTFHSSMSILRKAHRTFPFLVGVNRRPIVINGEC